MVRLLRLLVLLDYYSVRYKFPLTKIRDVISSATKLCTYCFPKLKEPVLLLHCKEEDVSLVESVLEAAKRAYADYIKLTLWLSSACLH